MPEKPTIEKTAKKKKAPTTTAKSEKKELETWLL
jgi:hypothetical protein